MNEGQLSRRLIEQNAIEREKHGAFAGATELRYWRNDKTGAEIDFVGRRVGLGLESKYVDASWRGEAKTLIARGSGGVCVTRSIMALDHDDVIAIPAGVFAWVVDG